MDMILAYVTVPHLDEAKSLGKTLLERKLAACVNLIPGMASLYYWEGQLQEDQEVVMLVKTRRTKFAELVDFIKTEHSYTVPCVLQLEVKDGNAEYLQWLGEQC